MFLGAYFIRLNELDQGVLGLAGCQKINPIDVNQIFTSKEVSKFLMKNSADKI